MLYSPNKIGIATQKIIIPTHKDWKLSLVMTINEVKQDKSLIEFWAESQNTIDAVV